MISMTMEGVIHDILTTYMVRNTKYKTYMVRYTKYDPYMVRYMKYKPYMVRHKLSTFTQLY